jgi:hypothetical protein
MKCTSIFALTVLAAMPALALNDSTWVSRSGADLPACGPIASPCATFQFAHDQTNSDGIVRALDAGEYGKVTISKAITIDGNGVGAYITVTTFNGVGVNVQSSGGVTIQNLTIHVTATCPGACYGIYAANPANPALGIENVSITGAPGYGVDVAGGRARIHRLTVTGAAAGIYVQDATVDITDSTVGNSDYGIYVRGFTALTQALIERSKTSANGWGLYVENAGAAATARISDCVIFSNTTGVATINGGQIISFRNNSWVGNTNDGATPLSISLK